jgi:hypothetical protein
MIVLKTNNMASVHPFIPARSHVMYNGDPFLSDDCQVLELGFCYYDINTGEVLTHDNAYKSRFLNSRNKMPNFFDKIEINNEIELSVSGGCLMSRRRSGMIDKSVSDLHGIVKEICDYLTLYSESKCIATFSSADKPCFLNDNTVFIGDSIFEIDTYVRKTFPIDFSTCSNDIFSIGVNSICSYSKKIFKQYDVKANIIKDMTFAHYQDVKGFVNLREKSYIMYTETEISQSHSGPIKVGEKSKQKLIVKNFDTGDIVFETIFSMFEITRRVADVTFSKFIGCYYNEITNEINPIYTISYNDPTKPSICYKTIIIGSSIIKFDFVPRDTWFTPLTNQIIAYNANDRTVHFFSIDIVQNCKCTDDCSRKCECACHISETNKTSARQSFILKETKIVMLKSV